MSFQAFGSLISTKDSPDVPKEVLQGETQTSEETMEQIASKLEKIARVMSAVLKLKPSANNASLMPLWLNVVRPGFIESFRL